MPISLTRLTRTALLALLPTSLVRPIVNRMGCRIDKSARVGFSLVNTDLIELGPGARIGHLNRLSGPFDLVLASNGAIGNFNTILRAKLGVAVGHAALEIGAWSKITSRHLIDVTKSITIGKYSVVAGNASQLWTHAYVHDTEGLGRYRIDGPVSIGDNVYIGSMSFISLGVRIGNGVIVGGGTSVATDLLEPALYVSSPIRMIPRPSDPASRPDLEALSPGLTEDRVFVKR
jgi:acetyltransferase-like isoleucine patch superfamily enzyme